MDQLAMPPGDPERWLPVVDWEGLYEVSSLGRVRGLERMVGAPGAVKRLLPARVLKQSGPFESSPYRHVTLVSNDRERRAKVHVLVAEAFLGPRPDGYDVCHGPAGKLDNSAANLSYGTRSKNLGEDRRRDGTTNAGVRNGNAKLTDEIVRQCRARASRGERPEVLAREFGVTTSTVLYVVNGATWRHLLTAEEADALARKKQDAILDRERDAILLGLHVTPKAASGVALTEGVTLRFGRRHAA